MGWWDKLTGELIDIIEWTDDSNDSLVWRFERYQNEIKNGAQLTVRQGQVAIFVNEGQIADVFTPGMHQLETNNLPLLSTLKGWKYGFNSPFKAEVYFINTRTFTANKWGTKNPIMLRDPEFGPIRIRAFGNFNIKVTDPTRLLEDIVGTDGHFTLDEIHNQLRTLAVSRFSDAIGESQLPVLDMAANYDELSELMRQKMADDFAQYGLSLQRFLVENISLPENVEAALDKRSSMGILGNLNQYTQYQSANALEQAAQNPSGGASSGMGMGMGFAMANQMANSMGNTQQQAPQQAPASPATPPPLPTQSHYFLAINGQQVGPLAVADIKHKVQQNEVNRSTLAWTEGMANWTPVSDIDELKPLFASMPPPIPGQ